MKNIIKNSKENQFITSMEAQGIYLDSSQKEDISSSRIIAKMILESFSLSSGTGPFHVKVAKEPEFGTI